MADFELTDERRRPRQTSFGALNAGMIVRGSVPASVLYGAEVADETFDEEYDETAELVEGDELPESVLSAKPEPVSVAPVAIARPRRPNPRRSSR